MSKEDISVRVSGLLEEYLGSEEMKDRQLDLYRVQYKKEGKDWILRVFIEKNENAEDEYVSIDECELVTRYLSEKLDTLDFIDRSYNLEVSSPGLDRELIKESDYTRFAGRLVEVKTYQAVSVSGNNVKNFEGILEGKFNDDVVISVSDDEKITIPQDKISKINLAVVF